MGRDVQDWTILDVQAGQDPIGGLGYGIEEPDDKQAPHKFFAMTWETWYQLVNLAHFGDVIRFEKTIANVKGAGMLYLGANPTNRAAIRRLFAFIRTIKPG